MRARVDQQPAARATDDRDGPAREAPIAQIETAAPPGARTEPAALQATRAAAPAPTLLEPIPPAEPRRPERPSPMPEPLAAPRVHIGRLEVIVVAPSQPPARPAQRSSADLASRRYLRNA